MAIETSDIINSVANLLAEEKIARRQAEGERDTMSEQQAEMARRLTEQEQQLADKDRQLAEMDRQMRIMAEQLEAARQQIAKLQAFMAGGLTMWAAMAQWDVVPLSKQKARQNFSTMDNECRDMVGAFVLHSLQNGAPQQLTQEIIDMSAHESKLDNLTEALRAVAEKPASVGGDLVMGDKHVGNAIGTVEAGGIGVADECTKGGNND